MYDTPLPQQALAEHFKALSFTAFTFAVGFVRTYITFLHVDDHLRDVTVENVDVVTKVLLHLQP